MFKLKRYFSVASLIGIGLVIVGLSALYRQIALDALVEQETRAHVALSTAISNAIWSGHGDFITSAAYKAPEQLLGSPELSLLGEDIRRHLAYESGWRVFAE